MNFARIWEASPSSREEHLVSFPRIMRNGDLVVCYERHDSMDHLYLEAGKIFNNKFGAFHHNDFIGKPFGAKVQSRSSSGWLYALEPTPDLWGLAVHTRTQIVNELDSSVVIQQLDLFPGCRVVESGTGSGCMSLALARAVYPNGKVFTFEFNPVRAETAKKEFISLGVSEVISVSCGDACGKFEQANSGFVNVACHSIHAVFLDLPEPWLALDEAIRVLIPGRPICCYSPCIEQVMQTCDKLRELGFQCIKMIESRQRPFDGRSIEFEVLDLGSASAPISASAVQSCGDDSGVAADAVLDEVTASDPQTSTNNGESSNEDDSNNNNDSRKRKLEINESSSGNNNKSSSSSGSSNNNCTVGKHTVHSIFKQVARPISSMKGHTAFLTFAFAPTVKMSTASTSSSSTATLESSELQKGEL